VLPHSLPSRTKCTRRCCTTTLAHRPSD
jgi:hypothetical protein